MITFTGVLAVIFGFVFLELMKWFAGIVVWVFIWAFFACECLMALFFYQRSVDLAKPEVNIDNANKDAI